MKKLILTVSILFMGSIALAQDTNKKPEKVMTSPSMKDTINAGKPQKVFMEKKSDIDSSKKPNRGTPRRATFEATPQEK